MKKILINTMVILLLISFTGCTDKNNTSVTTSTTSASQGIDLNSLVSGALNTANGENASTNTDLNSLLSGVTGEDGQSIDLNSILSNTGSENGENSDLSSLFYGAKLNEFTGEARNQLIQEAKASGVDIIFNTDGSTTMKYEDGSQAIQHADGTWTMITEEGEQSQFGGSWPSNEFTKLIPKPDFSIVSASTEANNFTVAFSGVSIEKIREYAEKVKSSGFNSDVFVDDQNLMGMSMYTFTANNSSNYTIEIFSAAGISGLTITKNN